MSKFESPEPSKEVKEVVDKAYWGINGLALLGFGILAICIAILVL